MEVATSRFGKLNVNPEELISVPKGILGFEHLKKYFIVEKSNLSPFIWFQSAEEAGVAFPLIDPACFYPDYRIEVDPRELGELNISDVKKVQVYVLVTVPPGKPEEATADLMGPILVNGETRLAKQVVLSKSPYSTRYSIFKNGLPQRPRPSV